MKPSEIKKNRVYCGQDGRRYVLHRGRDFVQYSPMLGNRVLASAANISLTDFAQWALCVEPETPGLEVP